MASWQQQRPFESAAAGKVEQGDGGRPGRAHQGGAHADRKAQEQAGERVVRQHGRAHLPQDLAARGIPRHPGSKHGQHRQQQQAGKQEQRQVAQPAQVHQDELRGARCRRGCHWSSE
jgi:hypothetical protein